MYQYHSLSPGVLVTAQERAVRPLLSGRLGSALAFNKLTRISGLQDGLQIEKQNIVNNKKTNTVQCLSLRFSHFLEQLLQIPGRVEEEAGDSKKGDRKGGRKERRKGGEE